ncbi:MAG: MATE family efflux transporter [Planctomycetes bacterium]|nr:MATE family efflux transporter [Planctomycetota bacterium]
MHSPSPEPTAPAPAADIDAQSLWSALRAALRGREFDYTKGSLPRAVLLLAVPMVIEMGMESLFAVADAWFVKERGEDALAAVALTEAMSTIVYAIAIGLSMATTSLVARRVGAGDLDGARRAAGQAIRVGVLLGVLLGIPCALFPGDLLGLMGGSERVRETGAGYAGFVLGGNVVILLLFLNNAIFRGAGDAVIAMKALVVSNAANLVLDPCLIFGIGPFPELGVTGAGLATLIGRSLGVAYQFHALRDRGRRVHLAPGVLRHHASDVRELLRTSYGGVGQFLLATASWMVLVRIVAPFGDAALAGHQVGVRIVMFTILPAFGLSNATATLVGQNLGAGKVDRARRSIWLVGLWNMAFMGVVAVVFIAFAPELVALFAEEATDRATMERVGVECLRIISYGYLFYAWGMVAMQAFNGAGKTIIPTWLNFICFWIVEVPLAWALAHPAGLGTAGVYWSVAISESLLAVLSIVVMRRVRWG